MSEITAVSQAPTSGERRAYVRVPCSQAAFCCSLTPRDYIFWAAKARDISTAGIRLILNHHFDPGTMLSVELLSIHQGIARQIQARVVYASAQSGGGWTVGCEFVNRLSDAELQALL